jgi:hypothetical protein
MFSNIRYFTPRQHPGQVSHDHHKSLMSRMKECYGSGHEAHWQMDVGQASAIKSRVYEDSKHEEWCLDAGMDDENTNGQPVVINKVRLFSETL